MLPVNFQLLLHRSDFVVADIRLKGFGCFELVRAFGKLNIRRRQRPYTLKNLVVILAPLFLVWPFNVHQTYTKGQLAVQQRAWIPQTMLWLIKFLPLGQMGLSIAGLSFGAKPLVFQVFCCVPLSFFETCPLNLLPLGQVSLQFDPSRSFFVTLQRHSGKTAANQAS